MAERFGVVYFADTSSFCGQSAHHQLPGFFTPLACLEQRLLGHVGCAAARMHAPIRAQYINWLMLKPVPLMVNGTICHVKICHDLQDWYHKKTYATAAAFPVEMVNSSHVDGSGWFDPESHRLSL